MIYDLYDKDKTCSVKYLVFYPEAKKSYFAYRDVGVHLNLDRNVRVSFGPQFNAGTFGMAINIMTAGLSGLMVDSANNIKMYLEGAISRALSKQMLVQDIITQLSLILCEVEAANLAAMACENSKVVDQSAHIQRVRQRYQGFLAAF